MRGAGTSIAGNAVGTGIVVDTTRHLNRVLSIDPEARTATVEPGTVHATLQRAADRARAALRPGPVDAHPLHDRRDDRQQRLRLAGPRLRPHRRQRRSPSTCSPPTAAGSAPRAAAPRCTTGSTPWSPTTSAPIRTEFGRFTRQVSGYCLEHLLPEHGRDLSTGSWSAARAPSGVVAGATVRLVEDAPVPGAGRARLPRHVRGRRRRPGPAAPPAGRLRGPGLPDRRRGARRHRQRARPAPRRRLAVRRGHRRPPPRRRTPPPPPWPRTPARSTYALVTDARGDGRAVADPGGRRRARRAQPGPPGALRLGGRRGAAGAARRLPARVRRAAARVRPRRRALRPLRRRLRARAHRLPARPSAAAGRASGRSSRPPPT